MKWALIILVLSMNGTPVLTTVSFDNYDLCGSAKIGVLLDLSVRARVFATCVRTQ